MSGTHTRRDDLEALHAWLTATPALKRQEQERELSIERRASLTQTEAMSGELIQDIILVVSVEVARSVSENAWRAVETWLRNRRRFAGPEEAPRVTLDGPSQGAGSGLSRDSGTGRAPDTGREAGGRDPVRGGDEPEEV
ncbi:hypothetical protein [Streptomyces griseus]|uniref:hypothetical protein n=1 Tax=Streptomyces griseus TaxID=1911 RepID=UPI0020C77F4D|nr:hypothetical protein [Streptomyces griseus]